MKRLVLVSVFFVCGNCFVFGQDDVVTPNRQPQRPTMEQIRSRDFERRRAAMARLSNLPREPKRDRVKKLSKAERRRFQEATAPTKEEKQRYKKFLKSSRGGIFRLLPNNDCETEKLIRVDGVCKGFVPGAWAYSFRLKDYSDEDFHDISISGDDFVTRSLLTQGILVDLGEVPIEEIEPIIHKSKFLVDFLPSNERAVARKQYGEISKGLDDSGYFFSNRVPVKAGHSYAVRSIAYRFKDKWASRLRERNRDKVDKNELKFAAFEFDERIDATFVFQVVRRDDDGSVTIVWKRISKRKAPRLVFEKDEALEDFRDSKINESR